MSGMSGPRSNVWFCKVDAALDAHPKIRRGGRACREVFLFVLRRHKLLKRADGAVPAGDVDPWYLADQLMMPEAEAAQGIERAVAVRLLARDGDLVRIVGWDDEWAQGPLTEAERKAAQRARVRTVTNGPDTARDMSGQCPDNQADCPDTSVTDRDCPDSHAGEERRGEKRKGESESSLPRDPGVPVSQPEAAPAPAPTQGVPPVPASASEPIRDRQETVLHRAWKAHGEAFTRLQADGIEPGARAPTGIPMGTGESDLRARIQELRGKGLSYDEIADRLAHRIAVAEAEARATRSLRWVTSSTLWRPDSFWRALDLSLEQAAQPRQPPRRARGTPPAPPANDHPVSTQLEGFE